MPLKIGQQYVTQSDALYDMASNSKYFDESGYAAALQAGRGDEYSMAVIGASDQEAPVDFVQQNYDRLTGTDKLDYLATTFYMDKTSTDTDEQGNTYNVYDRAMEYFNYKISEAESAEIYANMSGFEKGMATIGTMLGEAANAIYGIIENVIDAGILIGGGLADAVTFGQFHEDISGGTKWAISKDLTGTGYIAEQLADFRHKYTAIDKNKFLQIMDEVTVGIARMMPLFVFPGTAFSIAGKAISYGSLIYGASMFGGTAAEAIQKNPDIDLFNLTTYTGLVTAVEYGTEWLSGKIFGGADFIGHAMTGQPLRQAGGWLKRIGLDFMSEAFEESVSEVIDSCLDVALVGSEDSHFATLQEVLWAGLIGGVTGAVVTGASMAGTRNYGITSKGEIVDYKDAKAAGITDVKKLKKIDTINLREALGQAQLSMRQDAVEDFYAKYEQKGLSRQQAIDLHKSEYNKAVEARNITQKTVSDAVAVLSKVMEWAGVDGFNKALQNANNVAEKRAALIRNYAEYNSSENPKLAAVEKIINDATPGSKCKISEDLTAAQLRIQDTFKKEYGIDLYYGDFAEVDGNPKNHSVTINENTIVLDNNQFKNSSYEHILNKVAKKQLVQALQYRSGILSKDAISSLKMTLSQQTRYDASTNIVDLETTSIESLSDSELKLYADKQADALSQMLLFDEITISKVFAGNINVFQKIYKWLNKTADFFKNFGKKDNLNKLQYNQLLKTRQMYQQAIANLAPNKQYLEDEIKELGIDDVSAKRMRDAFDTTIKSANAEHWALIPLSKTDYGENYELAYQTFNTMVTPGVNIWTDPFNPENYKAAFVESLQATYGKPNVDFKTTLQDYLADNYGFMIDEAHDTLVATINWRDYTTDGFNAMMKKFVDSGKIDLKTLQENLPTVDSLFTETLNGKIYDENTGNTLHEIELEFADVNRALTGSTEYGETINGKIRVFIDTNTTDVVGELQEMQTTIYHEAQHLVANWTNFFNGGNPEMFKESFKYGKNGEQMAKQLWAKTQNISWEEALRRYDNDPEILYGILGEYVYSNLKGEQIAENISESKTERFMDADYFDYRETDTKNGRQITLVGYGYFKGIILTANVINDITPARIKTQTEIQNVGTDAETTPDFDKVKNKRYWKNDVKTLLDQRNVEINDKTYVSGIGDAKATNEVIKILYPNNKYATTVEYVDNAIDNGLAYGEMYRKLNPDMDVNTPHTYEEIKSFVDNAIREKPELKSQLAMLQDRFERQFAEWLSRKEDYKSRRDFFNMDFDYSLNDIKRIETALSMEVGIRGTVAKEKQLGETDDGTSKIENVADEEAFYEIDEKLDEEALGFSGDSVNSTMSQILPKIQESIDLPESFEYLKNLVQYAQTLNTDDKKRLSEIMKERNWSSKKGYLKQIDALTENFTETQKAKVQNDIKDFNSPLDYIEYIDDLKSAKSKVVKQEQIKATAKESVAKKITTEEKNVSRETIKKPEKLTLYHGTNADVVSFDSSKFGTGEGGANIPGVYLTTNKTRASEYGSNVLKTNVTINNAYNENVTPIKNGIDGTDFVKEYIPSWYDSKTDSIVDTQKGYVDEKLNSTTGLYDLIQVAIDKNPKLSFQSIMEGLGYDAVKQNNDYIVLDPTKVKIEQPRVEKKPKVEEKKATIEDISKPSETVKPKEPNTVSKQILDSFKVATTGVSESQYFSTDPNVYDKVGYDMINSLAPVFTAVTDANYEEVRNDIKNDKSFYADQALMVFDLYTLEMKGKFSQETQDKIEANNRRSLTISAQKLALQAKRVANRTPITNELNAFNSAGYNAKVSDEQLQAYDEKLKNKDAYIKELSDKIATLEQQLKENKNVLDQADIIAELKQTSEHKLILENGTNEDYADWLVNNAETLEQASKIQNDILKKAFDAAKYAAENKKDVGYYFKDKDGKPKAFPKLREKLAKALKKIRSFRVWAMLSSPITWIRNWIGNKGMQALDSVTNAFERTISKNVTFAEGEMKYNETRAGKEVYDHIANTSGDYIMSLVRGETSKYDTTGAKYANAQHAIRGKEYESANALEKLFIKAQNLNEWGLSRGVFGDEPVVYSAICKNMGNLVASNKEYLLQGIQQEYDRLSKKSNLSTTQQARMDLLKKALDSKSAIDIYDAMSKEETERLFKNADVRAKEQYFKNQNNFNKWISELGQKNPVMAEIISWVMPFPKVAANILTMAYKYSPLNFINGLMQRSQYKQISDKSYTGPKTGFEKAEMIRTFSQATTGTFMLIAGAIAAALGWIDIDDDDYLGPSLKIGDMKIGLSNLAPSMTTFSTAAALVWAWKNDKSGVSEALNVLYDNTLLGNVDNLFRYSSLESFGQNLSISYLSQYIPAVLKWTNKSILKSPQKDKTGSYFNKLIKTLGSYVPGVSALVPNKIDPYTGRPVYASGSDNWFLNFIATSNPLDIKYTFDSELESEASFLGVETTGLKGSFNINEKTYTAKNKESLAKYRADYIQTEFDKIKSGKQLVTVETDDGKKLTTTYNRLDEDQKAKVLKNLYSKATNDTKIKYWTKDLHHKYYTSNKDEYNRLSRKFGTSIKYVQGWNKSKFVE